MADLFQPLNLPDSGEPKLNPSFKQTLTSAFGLENDVANFYDYMTRDTFPPNPAFKFQDRFKKDKLPLEMMQVLAPAQSDEEYDAILGRVKKEALDKQVLAASGWTGTVAALSAGMLSPTVFIPFTGQAKGGMAIAEMLGLAAAAGTAQNAALFLNQETRTEAEFYTGVAMDTLFTGALGGAYLGLSKAGRARLVQDFEYNSGRVDIPTGKPDLPQPSSKPTRVEPPEGAEVKRMVREEGVRDPADVAEMLEEAGATNLSLRDKPLQIGKVRNVATKLADETPGRGVLEVDVADGVTARFSRVEAGTGNKWLADGEFAITLRTSDGTEIVIPAEKLNAKDVAGGTGISKEAQLKKALADGDLDEQLYKMMETADEPRMAPTDVEGTIRTSEAIDAKAVGAAPSRVRNTLGAKQARNRFAQKGLDTLGKMSPAYRGLTNKFFPSVRNAWAKLDMAGIQQAGLKENQPSAAGGTVQERIRGYDPYIVQLSRKLDENFYNYTYDGKKGFDLNSPALTQLKSRFGRGVDGKLNWAEYKAAVFDGINTGELDPKLKDSADAMTEFFEKYTARQEQYLDEFAAQGLEIEPLFKVMKADEMGEGVSGYAHHLFDQNLLMDKLSEFLDDFSGAYDRQLNEAFDKAKVRYGKRKANLEFEKLISTLEPDELRVRLADTEADIEFLNELPEYQGMKAEQLDVQRQAKEEDWPKEQLKTALKDLRDNYSDDVKALVQERKELMATARSFRKFGGNAQAETAKLQAAIAKGDELISNMFRDTLPRIQSADISIAKIQSKGDKALASATSDITKVVKALNARRAQMSKLLGSKRANSASRLKVAEKLDEQKLKYDGMLERLEAVKGKQVALDDHLKELHLLREEAVADATRLVRNRAAKLEVLEDKLEIAEAKVMTPEERLRMGDQVENDLWDLDVDFNEKWSAKGDVSGDSVNATRPDFTAKTREMATMLHQKLTNGEVSLSPAYRALRQDARGAELLRVMKIPYNMKQKWLVKDLELVARAYDRTMAPDLELWRAFDGSVNAKSLLGEMQMEVTAHMTRIGTAKFVRLPKGWVDKAAAFKDKVKKRLVEFGDADDIYLDAKNFSDTGGAGFVPITPELRNQLAQSVQDAAKAATTDIDVAIQRLRMTRGVPADANAGWYRAGKFVKDVNTMTMMGGVVVSSVSDAARPIWQHGIAKTFKHGWAPFINKLNPDAKRFRLRSKEINQQVNLNNEPLLHGRAQSVFGLFDQSNRHRSGVVGSVENAAGFGARKMGLFAMFDYWTAGMKTISGNVTHATMAAYIPAVAAQWRKTGSATMSGDLLNMQTYLRNLGLQDLDIHRIAQQMEKADGVEHFSNGGVLPNLDKWDDMAAYQAYQAAVLGEVNKLIVTPGLERPNMVDENMAYSMLFQFKSFVFASNSRMAMSALQGNDPYLMQGIAFSIAFGALSYYTYAQIAGGKTLEEANEFDPQHWIWEAVKRSGMLGAAAIGADIGENIPVLGGDGGGTFAKPSRLLGAFLGPTYSQADKMAEYIMKMNSDDPKQQARNLKTLRQVWVPLQNHTVFRMLFDRVAPAMFGG